MRIVEWSPDRKQAVVERFLRRPAVEPVAERVAAEVLADIARRGDAAVLAASARFDGLDVPARGWRVTAAELAAARQAVDADFRRAARAVRERIRVFARAQRRADWRMASPGGGWLGEKFQPYERVGCYIPGGAAPLASSALMTVSIAAEAGVSEIVACTPAGRTGAIDPYLLYALDLAGATEIYRLGGIQAIGALAYGTRTIRAVQKIVGPGGPYVTAAKKLVYGRVALDMVAGPSEIAVLADDSAPPEFVAADLLSQAEHGTGSEKALLITPSAALARAVVAAVTRQTRTLSRAAAIRRVLRTGALAVVTPDLNAALELANRFAPEHLELMVRRPRAWLRRVRCAGAVFLGPWTPESAGDFAAGPSHVLPTGGTAALFSGLSLATFLRRTSVVELTRAGLREVLPIIEQFGRVEQLDAHARAGSIRFAARREAGS
ncbi:MAG: histidinol dehydrogenase [Candidatus Marinimicrobia bacterium]|nr:histidinol dehydrogenase [Candidatus Neomarinimicrobiota bacterium]